MIVLSQPLFHKALSKNDLVVTQSGFVTTDGTWHQRPMYAAYSRLYYVTKGRGMLICEGGEMPLEPGYVYLAPCGMRYGFYGCDSVTKLYFHINLFTNEQGEDPFARMTHFSRLPLPVAKIDQLTKWYLSTEPLDHLMLKGELYRTVCKFIQIEQLDAVGEDKQQSVVVSEAIRYICANLSARLSVGEIAEAVFCSQSKLSMLFRAARGQSVSGYVDDLLMSEAQNQLLYSDKSIGRISEKLGFCDQFYFSRIFKKRFGMSPNAYRKLKK